MQYKLLNSIIAFSLVLIVIPTLYGQQAKKHPDIAYFTLKNGLSIYLVKDTSVSSVNAKIVVNAGSKDDPTDCTGLAHYLEHILFKGNHLIGALNWEKEEVLLNTITQLYEKKRNCQNESCLLAIENEIDSLSGKAGMLFTDNEYAKLLEIIGGKNYGATTSPDKTVYYCDLPKTSLDSWLFLESVRFSKVIPRGFRNEMSVIGEEKNKNYDNLQKIVTQQLFSNMFGNTAYGSLSTIGNWEHLRNPSILKLMDFYNTYYVPANMAICITGNIDIDTTYNHIKKHWQKVNVKGKFNAPKFENTSLNIPLKKDTIINKFPELFTLSYKLSSLKYNDRLALDYLSHLFSTWVKEGNELIAFNSYTFHLKESSLIVFQGKPSAMYTMDELEGIVSQFIELIQEKKFDKDKIELEQKHFIIEKQRSLQKKKIMNDYLVQHFINKFDDDYFNQYEAFSFNAKKSALFAKKYFHDNYVVIYKQEGIGIDTDISISKKPIKNASLVKLLSKRKITEESDFYYSFLGRYHINQAKYQFDEIDFTSEISQTQLSDKCRFLYKENGKNSDRFYLKLIYDVGDKISSTYLGAFQYWLQVGFDSLTNTNVMDKFKELETTYSVQMRNNKVYFSLKGPNKCFDKSLQLFCNYLYNPSVNKEVFNKTIKVILAQRAKASSDKDVLLNQGLLNYLFYKSNSPLLTDLNNSEIANLPSTYFVDKIKALPSYHKSILFYGNIPDSTVTNTLKDCWLKERNFVNELSRIAEDTFSQNEILVYDYPLEQTEIYVVTQANKFSKQIVSIEPYFNHYFGGGINSLLFKRIREQLGLAYSVVSKFNLAKDTLSYNYNIINIKTSPENVATVIDESLELLDTLPCDIQVFEHSRKTILKQLSSQKISGSNLLSYFNTIQRYGFDVDYRKDIYNNGKNLSMNDLINFHSENIKNNHSKVLIFGDVKKMDIERLQNFGKITFLEREDILAY